MLPSVIELYICKGNLSICKGVFLPPERDDSNCLETLISGECMDLNLHYNLTLVYHIFAWLPPVTGLVLPPPPQHLLSLARDGTKGDGLGYFGLLLSFPESLLCI